MDINELLQTFGHDLRTPITPLKTELQLMRRRLIREQGRDRDVQSVSRSLYQVERMQHQIAAYMDAAYLVSGQRLPLNKSPQDLLELTHRIVDIYSWAGAGDELRLDLTQIDGETLTGQWDRARVELVLQEILSNALKFSPGPSVVRIARQGWMAWVAVEDSGPEVVPEVRARIFEAFSFGSQRNHGLGLGLYTCREIIHLHGGDIGLETTGSGGNRFWFTLPLETGMGA